LKILFVYAKANYLDRYLEIVDRQLAVLFAGVPVQFVPLPKVTNYLPHPTSATSNQFWLLLFLILWLTSGLLLTGR
jgi:hypothetical protein